MNGFHPTTWELVAVSVPSVMVGGWALWDSWQSPKCPWSGRLAIAVSLGSLIQWTVFLALRASGVWDADDYETIAAPYRLLVLSPVGGWGIWFSVHWFSRRQIRRLATTGNHDTTHSDKDSIVEGG
jgi:hypothetical protein